MHRVCLQMKLLCQVRHPFERMWSYDTRSLDSGKTRKSLSACVETDPYAISNSLYALQLSVYLTFFLS